MFSDDEWTQAKDTHLAPGPAAFSDANANGNGPGNPEDKPTEPAPKLSQPVSTLIWISEAPPMAILIVAASGAILFAIFAAILHATKGSNGAAGN